MGLFVFAYRTLLFYDPQATNTEGARGAEALLFAPAGSSPIITLAVVAWLSFSRLSLLCQRPQADTPWLTTSLVLAPGIALFLWANYVSAPDILIASLGWILAGIGLILGGTRGLRLLLLPACFLIFAIPIPVVLVNEWVWPLQLWTGKAAVWILSFSDMSPILHGDIIHTAKRTFQVIETCSGLRTIETLTMASVLYAHLFFRSRLQAVILVIAAPFIGFAVNVARVLTIIINPYSEVGSIHTVQGIVMLVVGVLLIAAFDRFLTLVLPASSLQRRTQPIPSDKTQPQFPRRAVYAGILLVCLGATTLIWKPWSPEPQRDVRLFRVPIKMDGGWETQASLPLDKEFMGSARVSEWVHRTYERKGKSAQLLVVSDNRLDRSTHILSPKIAVPGPGWELEESSRIQLDPNGPTIESGVYGSHGRQQLTYQWYENFEEKPAEFLRHIAGLDRSHWRRTPGRGIAIRVSTTIAPGFGGLQEARSRLNDFARATQKGIRQAGIIEPQA